MEKRSELLVVVFIWMMFERRRRIADSEEFGLCSGDTPSVCLNIGVCGYLFCLGMIAVLSIVELKSSQDHLTTRT